MGHSTCCVVNCKNNGVRNKCKFYQFPTAKHKVEQRNKWIAAVRRINPNGSPWCPKPWDVICSEHFIGNKKSEEVSSPSYIPTIFPSVYKTKVMHTTGAMKRYERFMQRRINKSEGITSKASQPVIEELTEQSEVDNNAGTSQNDHKKQNCDQECQVDIFSLNFIQPEKVFICNRYINNTTSCCDSEIQTEIISPSLIMVPNKKQFKDKKCSTLQKIYVDQSVGPDIENDECTSIATTKSFAGISSIKNNEQCLDLTGVSLEHFQFLLKRINNTAKNCQVSKENRLFIFLVKMKTGLTFSAISVLFSVHRTTISRIFFSTLQELSSATANLVFWPSKDVVQGTMPECFRPDYSNTRVIIDCTDFGIEIPANFDHRVYTYSHYKKGFTAKLLIGITPAGFISFKSKVAGGRESDSQMTIESGLLDLLEDGDIVLADKGFPEIRRIIDQTGKKVVLVMPPFLEKKSEFTKEETEETYNIARVRIHIERIMQRLRTYQILDKIPDNLFSCIDDIIHVCCVLVNLQPPIISDQNTDKKK
ncbi:uncharacterized protein [Venturia canescens]|uniref:uncharacterized protein n=1 Tax=Venturia canescens TaxID=32260 RepID=UPI001C9CA8C7|nr:uncharacterized protein LOC122411055 [Venturia canescens]